MFEFENPSIERSVNGPYVCLGCLLVMPQTADRITIDRPKFIGDRVRPGHGLQLGCERQYVMRMRLAMRVWGLITPEEERSVRVLDDIKSLAIRAYIEYLDQFPVEDGLLTNGTRMVRRQLEQLLLVLGCTNLQEVKASLVARTMSPDRGELSELAVAN